MRTAGCPGPEGSPTVAAQGMSGSYQVDCMIELPTTGVDIRHEEGIDTRSGHSRCTSVRPSGCVGAPPEPAPNGPHAGDPGGR